MPFIKSVSSLLAAASLAVSVVAHGNHGLSHAHLHHQRTVIDSGDNGLGDGQVHTRLEISDLAANRPNQWSLFIQAMKSFQEISENDTASYFQVAGIHGVPRVSYDGVEACDTCDGADGYCTHDSVLFPAWHRTYMALYEQEFLKVALNVANSYPAGAKRNTMLAAQSTLRFPYWDWAANPASGSSLVPTVMSSAQVTINGPNGKETIDNPISVYKLPSNEVSGMYYSPFSVWPETLRYPNSDDSDATSQQTSMVNAFDNIRDNLQDQIYNLLTNCDDYLHFSNDDAGSSSAKCANSLEGIHNTIHTTAGGPGSSGVSGGHMTYLPLAAFDPLFWLHHANVDRLFALWQTVHPDSYGASQTAPHNTWTIASGSTQDADSSLTPFRKDASTFWTTNDVQDWAATFKYTYPEFSTSDGSQASIISFINQLYGTNATLTQASVSKNAEKKKKVSSSSSSSVAPATTQAASSSTYSSAATSTTSAAAGENRSPEQGPPAHHDPPQGPPSNPVTGLVSGLLNGVGSLLGHAESEAQSLATRSLFSGVSGVLNSSLTSPAGALTTSSGSGVSPSFTTTNGSTYEYLCNIHTPRYALNGSYTVYVFGDTPASSNSADWLSDAGLIGTMGVLAGGSDMAGAHNLLIAGSIPMTRYLQKQVSAGKISSMSDEHCTPYLKKNLIWKVSIQGEEVDINNLEGFKAFSFQGLSTPATSDTLPVWGDLVPQVDVTLGKVGGAIADEYAQIVGAVTSLLPSPLASLVPTGLIPGLGGASSTAVAAAASSTGLIPGYGASSSTAAPKSTTTIVVTNTKTICPCTETGLSSY